MPPRKPDVRSYADTVAFVLSDQRKVNLYGEIDSYGSALAHIDNALDYLISRDKKKPINIMMNTPGGSVINGFAIYDTIMRRKKTTPINITAIGACMSMGVIIMQAATERRAMPNAEFLLHEVSYGERGSISSHKDQLAVTTRLQSKLDGVITGRSHIDQSTLEQLTKRRDYTISAQEALEHGLIDQII